MVSAPDHRELVRYLIGQELSERPSPYGCDAFELHRFAFQKQLGEGDIKAILAELTKDGHTVIDGRKVSCSL